MRPLPRLLAFTDDRVAVRDDLGVRAAAIAAVGPAVALVARRPGGTAEQLTALALRFAALAAPPLAAVAVTGRPDIARAAGASGVVLRRGDLDVADVRSFALLQIFRSVHDEAEAHDAVAAGADALVAGTIWPSATHPDREGQGTDFLARIVTLGTPVYAIGGVTAERAAAAHAAGAWGIAAISALWDAANSYRAAMELVKPWMESR